MDSRRGSAARVRRQRDKRQRISAPSRTGFGLFCLFFAREFRTSSFFSSLCRTHTFRRKASSFSSCRWRRVGSFFKVKKNFLSADAQNLVPKKKFAMSSYISRVNQLDAGKLDEEIFKIFSSKVTESSQLLTPGVMEAWTPEINASLRTIIWVWTLLRGKSTVGQKLLNLTYKNLTRNKAALLVLLSVVPQYLEEKFLDPNRFVSQRARPFVKYLDMAATFVSALNFLNLLAFLHRGQQPYLKERLLGIRSCNVSHHISRDVGYSFMIRELLWHGLITVFGTGLPMVNYHYLKQLFRKFISFSGRPKAVIDKPPKMDLNSLCPYCNFTPILPKHAGCRHIYCYYCMQAHFTASESFNCLVCGHELHRNNMKSYLVSPDS